jgi:trans-aconitate methyltransferase
MADHLDDFRERLDTLSKNYVVSTMPDAAVLALDRWWMDEYLRGPRVLELGCGDGTSTRMLVERAVELDVVEGSPRFCDLARQSVADPSVRITNCLYEDFRPDRPYDDIVFARSLDDIPEPVKLLSMVRGWLHVEHGRLHVVVQNAESLHRRIGFAAGLLPAIDHLSDHSIRLAHRRVYTKERLLSDLASAGFIVRYFKGYFLKPLDMKTLQHSDIDFATQLVPALFEVGKTVPDELCCQLYALCETRK